MSDLSVHVQDYLRLRRALGFKLEFPGHVLPQLAAYLDAAGEPTLTAALAVAWAGLPEGVQPISLAHRLGAARGFAKYLQTIEPATEVPPYGIWPSTAPRPVPYLWSAGDVGRLLDAAHRLDPPLRAATHHTLLGLLAATGLRIGEARRLDRDDVDLTDGVLNIGDAKFGRSRLVPLHLTVTHALGVYAECRDRLDPTSKRSARFFVSHRGAPLTYGAVHETFVALTTAIGLRTPTSRPRVHDLRHSFAVQTLIDWHRSDVDIDGRMAVLSTYLGHVSAAGTYWYLSAAPELMDLAVARLDRRFGTPS